MWPWRPSDFDHVRHGRCGRYAPRWTRPCGSCEPRSRSYLVVRPCHAVHACGGVSLPRREGRVRSVSTLMVEQCGEPFRTCSVHARSTHGSRAPGSAPGACFAGPRSPRPLSFAPPTPRTVARLCSQASPLLRRVTASRARASPATAHSPSRRGRRTSVRGSATEISGSTRSLCT